MKNITTIFGLLLSFSTLYAQADNYYSPGGWPTLHQDPGNRRAVDAPVLGNNYEPWTAIAGASALTVPVTSPDGTRLYFTTGLARGNANLHALTITGELLWQSDPWENANDGVDACAILSSPIVDTQGDIYISDCNQLFSFKPDGSVKWTIDLPSPSKDDWIAAGDHPVNAFTTAAFTGDGHILGVTNFGDVMIVERATGKVLNQPYRLAAVLSPYANNPPLPDSLLAQGLMDPAFREWAWQVIFGGSMRSANTPAIAKSGRVYVVGSSEREGIGALFGLDIDSSQSPFKIDAAFITEIGIGSGSSPALSPGEQQVYVSDEEGWFYAIDSQTGEIAWKVKTAAAAGAAAVGPDGTVYALQVHPAPAVVALSPDGNVLWQSDASSLLQDTPKSLLLGDPVAVANGNPVVTADAVLVPMMYGYSIPFTNFSIPVRSVIAALDLTDGKAIREVVELIDDSSGITAVLHDGTLVNSIGSVMTSALNPLKPLVDFILPDNLSMLEPVGGIQVSVPTTE